MRLILNILWIVTGGIWMAAASSMIPPRVMADDLDPEKLKMLDPARLRIVDRLMVTPPPAVSLATPFDVQIRFPKTGVVAVSSEQSATTVDDYPAPGYSFRASLDKPEPVVEGRNGQAIAKITPLLMGDVTFHVDAAFTDSGWAVTEFTLHVGPPAASPQKLLGDVSFAEHNDDFVAANVRDGDTKFHLEPVAFFGSAPGHMFMIRGWAKYRLLPNEGPPIISLTEDGAFSPLRLGTAMAEVSFAGATSQFRVVVMR